MTERDIKEGGVVVGGFVEGAGGCWDERLLPHVIYLINLWSGCYSHFRDEETEVLRG